MNMPARSFTQLLPNHPPGPAVLTEGKGEPAPLLPSSLCPWQNPTRLGRGQDVWISDPKHPARQWGCELDIQLFLTTQVSWEQERVTWGQSAFPRSSTAS